MESPLGWLLADCFIVNLENSILKRTIDICLYTRYLNDIYIIYDKNINDSQNTFINWHQSIKFTTESELDSEFYFLDVLVKKDLTVLYKDRYVESQHGMVNTRLFKVESHWSKRETWPILYVRGLNKYVLRVQSILKLMNCGRYWSTMNIHLDSLRKPEAETTIWKCL